MFQFGRREAALFLALLVPLAAALAALLMAIAIRCRTFKEAQANNTVVILGGVAAAAGDAVQPGRRGAVAPAGCPRSGR